MHILSSHERESIELGTVWQVKVIQSSIVWNVNLALGVTETPSRKTACQGSRLRFFFGRAKD